MNKKYLLVGIIVFFLLMPVYSFSLKNFDISVNISEPEKATIIELWEVDATNKELSDLKENILKNSVNLEELAKLNPDISPHIFIDSKNIRNFTISLDDIDATIRLEYIINEMCLISFLDYQDQIIWELNNQLFNQFVINGLFNIPNGAKISISLYEPLTIGDVVPLAEITGRTILWESSSSNDIRLLAIEKKPPKPTFVISNLFSKDYLNKAYFNVLFILLIIFLVLLIFRNRVNKGIKKFITKHSVIKPRKQINEIVDFDFVSKKK